MRTGWHQRAAVVIVVLASLCTLQVSAQTDDGKSWFMSMDLQSLVGRYSGSSARQGLDNVGVFLHADYYERAGLTVGYNRTTLDYSGDAADIEQENLFLGMRFGLTPDWADGRITLRLDGYDISQKEASSAEASAAMAQVSYLNFRRTLYWDLGYAQSDHAGTASAGTDLDLKQLTPTIGFGLNDQRDWLQLRAYLIEFDTPGNAAAAGDTSAIELKWTHWLPADGFLGLDSLRFSALGGERLHALDPDAAAMYNLADLQTAGLSVGGEWRIGGNSSLLLIAGIEDYEDRDLAEDYTSSFLYLNFSHEWD